MIHTTTKYKSQNFIGNADSIILICFLLYGFVSQYLFLSVLGGITAIVIMKLLWKPYLPPVLLFFMSFHWVQVFTCILYADFMGVNADVLFNSNGTEYLFGITFVQLMVMAYVLNGFLVKYSPPVLDKNVLRQAAEKLNTKNIIIGYFVTTFSLPFLISFSITSSSLYQLVLSFSIIKILFSGLLFFVLLLKDTKNKLLIGGILVFDFILSFASFFSNFKLLIVMLLVVYFTVNPKIKTKSLFMLTPILALLIMFLSFWSYVKEGYRSYLNQGSKQQVVAVSSSDALSYLYEKGSEFDLNSLREGGQILLSRIQYMERYSETYSRVPDVIKHRDGADLAYTLNFLLVPRFINQNKGVKDASERTAYYTGKQFSKAAQGTSISMGYFCDFYIDFGLFLMFIPLVLVAVLVGFFYKTIVAKKRYNLLFTYSLLIGTFLALGTFESDSLFFLGIMRNHAVFLILGYFTFFPFLHKFILNKN